MRAILPSAGFGTRVGSPPAKELLPHPLTHKTQIGEAIKYCLEAGLEPLVVTRKEKTQLLEWLRVHYSSEVQIQIIEPSREWPHTVLKSKPFWLEKNFLVLPDTDFKPVSILNEMIKSLEAKPAVFACFNPNPFALNVWGALQKQEEEWFIADKPKSWLPNARAWGLIGFRKQYGEMIFQSILDSYFSENRDWKKLTFEPEILTLESFQDLARL